MVDQTTDLWDEELEPGHSFVLTPEGWQQTGYLEPDDDWRLLDDGSYESPDGRIRTRPINNPTGD
ncbi:MAG TPA: hypothetical protein VNJ28_06920 [Candidatus Limnocylindrales bacterium]|jgi:hypothetical protein|nr:hypothetical protein [Candidatus Limnocylindrales bacterium]